MKKEDLEKQLSFVHEWIRYADQKISILFGILGVFLTVLISSFQWSINNLSKTPTSLVFYTASIIFLGYAFFKAFFSLYPRLKKNTKSFSLIYFGDIAGVSPDEYISRIKKVTGEDYKKELVMQIYNSSKIAVIKFKQFKDSLILFIIGISLSIISYLLFAYQLNYVR